MSFDSTLGFDVLLLQNLGLEFKELGYPNMHTHIAQFP